MVRQMQGVAVETDPSRPGGGPAVGIFLVLRMPASPYFVYSLLSCCCSSALLLAITSYNADRTVFPERLATLCCVVDSGLGLE